MLGKNGVHVDGILYTPSSPLLRLSTQVPPSPALVAESISPGKWPWMVRSWDSAASSPSLHACWPQLHDRSMPRYLQSVPSLPAIHPLEMQPPPLLQLSARCAK